MTTILTEHLIRHAYENTVTYAARLSLLATGKGPTSDGPIAEKQTMLGIDDLANFAYHSRRLLDLTETKTSFLSVKINSINNEELAIVRLLSVIIHQEHMGIIRTKFELKLAAGRDPIETLANHSNEDRESIPTLVSIKSKESRFMIFKLQDLIETFQEYILNEITDKCSNEGIYLEDF